jgi:hypothetical protein
MLLFALTAERTLQAQTPAPPEAWKKMLRLDGLWEGPATAEMNGKTYRFTYFADFKPAADGNGLYMEEWFSDPELGKMKGSNLIGYNPFDHMIHWFSVDNFGTTHDHTGSWKSEDEFVMEHQGMQEGKKYMETIILTFQGEDKMKLTLLGTLDGNTNENIWCDFQRKKKMTLK